MPRSSKPRWHGTGPGGAQGHQRIYGVNSLGAENLARLCAGRDIPFLTFSSDRVFDGSLGRPYVEGDETSPTCFLGGSKAEAERRVLRAHGGSLVIRMSRLFGPEDGPEQLAALGAASYEGRPFVTATYAPDLVRAALDLMIDGENGLWHLSNQGAVPFADYAGLFSLAEESSVDAPARLVVLGSERGTIMPPLREALASHKDCVAARRADASYAVAAE